MTRTKDEALKQALEALEELTVLHDFGASVMHDTNKAITAIKQALAAPTVQEPFAWCVDSENSADWAIAKTKEGVEVNAKLMDVECIKTAPFPLYTTPHATQKPWVGLTENERDDLVYNVFDSRRRVDLAVAIEALLKEKNEAKNDQPKA